jgi:hypothetical protein
MPFVKCPHCGEWHEITEIREFPPLEVIINTAEISPVAVAILQKRDKLPPQFLRGKPVALRVLGDTLGYGHSQVRLGLIELNRLGVIKTVDYGKHKKRYAGAKHLPLAKLA